MASLFHGGSWIWVPDKDHVVLPGKVVDLFVKGQPGKVEMEDGTVRALDGTETILCSELHHSCMSANVDNLTDLDDLNDHSLLHVLRSRFAEDKIYSNIGTILVSVNPFKPLPLYTPERMDFYKQGDPRDKAPHVFSIGHAAYHDLLNERKSQSVIITGESGAGKSEACKLVLQYIADLSASHSGRASDAEECSLEQQLLQANPILEAFGNAKTVRNNNSSRFGKLITIFFDRFGGISEGSIVSYLLEKSRVVSQADGERNYHIFYQLLAGAEAEMDGEGGEVGGDSSSSPRRSSFSGAAGGPLRELLQLESCEYFEYLNKQADYFIDGVVDEVDFEEVKRAMDTLEFGKQAKKDIWTTVAAVLHIGNLEFVERFKGGASGVFSSTSGGAGADGEDGEEGEDEEAKLPERAGLELVGKLLGVGPDELAKCLTTRKLSVGDVIVPYKVSEAKATRDAMAKVLYSFMFGWIIRHINRTLTGAGEDGSPKRGRAQHAAKQVQAAYAEGTANIIGVLDIFGFESFVVNSFEQLCINYCNEKLAFHFNQHVFTLEIAAYAEEGVMVSSFTFQDNKPILEFLESRSNGIFSMLDEQIMVNGTDEKFLAKLQQDHRLNEHHLRPKRGSCPDPNSRSCFGVLHYAGAVFYNVKDFLEKNKDALHQDVLSTLRGSDSPFIQDLLDGEGRSRPNSPVGRPVSTRTTSSTPPTPPRAGVRVQGMAKSNTLGKQFRAQLDDLMAILNDTEPHFIRCMKPNSDKKGGLFMAHMMLEQLRYSGLLEVCSIRKMGFPIRRSFSDFSSRYHCICPGLSSAVPAKDLIGMLTRGGKLQEGCFAVGKTKVLLKQDAAASLDAARDSVLTATVCRLQRVARGMICRQRLKLFRTILVQLHSAISQRSLPSLSHWLLQANELPNSGRHMEVVREAEALHRRLEAESKVVALLEDAVRQRDLNALTAALAAASGMAPPLGHPEGGSEPHPAVGEATKLKALLEAERKLKGQLREATNARNRGELEGLLELARHMGLSGEEVSEAEGLTRRMEEEDGVLAEIKAAVGRGKSDLPGLAELLGKARRVGVEGKEVDAARAELTRLQHRVETVKTLRAASERKHSTAIPPALDKLRALAPLDEDESSAVAEAEAMLATLAVSTTNTSATENVKRALSFAKRQKSLSVIDEALTNAREAGYTGEDLDELQAMRGEAREREAAKEGLQAALDSGDQGRMKGVLQEVHQGQVGGHGGGADAHFLALSEVKGQVDRGQRLEQVKRAICEGVNLRDLGKINSAMSTAIELGFHQEPEVERGRLAQKWLNEVTDANSKLNSVSRALSLKIFSKGGINEKDLLPLQQSITLAETSLSNMPSALQRTSASAAVKQGVKPVSSVMPTGPGHALEAPLRDAKALSNRCGRQLVVQSKLTASIASDSRERMTDALDLADELELQLEMMDKVRRMLKRMEEMGHVVQPQGELNTMTDEDIENFRAKREERHEKASNAKYKLKNYSKLRSRSDYAKGNLLHKRREMESMLVWQNTLCSKSLTELKPKEMNKAAVSLRKALLGYMGDKQMSFPEMLARNILTKGLAERELRDEIYVQMMKQLTDNPKAESTAKAWQLMCMCTNTFLPSEPFENFLLHFVLDKCRLDGAEACYARYCLYTLEGMMSSRTAEGIVLTIEEIQAYKERPPILATIELVNGALLTEDLPLAPDLNVVKILEVCAHFGGLQTARTDQMGLFVYDMGKAVDTKAQDEKATLPFTPSPLRNEDYLGDVFIRKARQRRNFRFIYKRKIFLHSHAWPTEDAAYNRLVYLQAEDDAIRSGTLEISDEQGVILLTAIAMVLEEQQAAADTKNGADKAKGSTGGEDGKGENGGYEKYPGGGGWSPKAVEQRLMWFVPPAWQRQCDKKRWSKAVADLSTDLLPKSASELEILFVEQCRERPMFGAHYFYAVKVGCQPDLMSHLPRTLLFAFSADGMHMFGVDRKELLQQYSYADVHSWRGTRRQVSLTIWDQDTDSVFELSLRTQQASDMASIILDHINSIMANGHN